MAITLGICPWFKQLSTEMFHRLCLSLLPWPSFSIPLVCFLEFIFYLLTQMAPDPYLFLIVLSPLGAQCMWSITALIFGANYSSSSLPEVQILASPTKSWQNIFLCILSSILVCLPKSCLPTEQNHKPPLFHLLKRFQIRRH